MSEENVEIEKNPNFEGFTQLTSFQMTANNLGEK